MAIQYKTANQLPIMEEVTGNTYALVEENGTLKRVSGSSLGGSSIKTAIIKSSTYDNAISGPPEMDNEAATYSCINMTFEEAHQTMSNGEPLQAIIMFVMDGFPSCLQATYVSLADAAIGVPTIAIIGTQEFRYFWTTDGISTTPPSHSTGPR